MYKNRAVAIPNTGYCVGWLVHTYNMAFLYRIEIFIFFVIEIILVIVNRAIGVSVKSWRLWFTLLGCNNSLPPLF